jgi:hypothetical protein
MTTALFVVVYALLPVEGSTTPDTVARLAIALIAFAFSSLGRSTLRRR